MQVNVRVNGVLAQKMHVTRFPVTLPSQATIEDLMSHLREEHPQLATEFGRAVTISSGTHLAAASVLREGQEVAVLLPIAGG